MLHVLHERCLAQLLHHGIVRRNLRLVIAHARDCLAQPLQRVEALVLPISRQVPPAALDLTVFGDQPGLVGAVLDRHQLHIRAVAMQQIRRPPHRKLPQLAAAQTAARHNMLGALPPL